MMRKLAGGQPVTELLMGLVPAYGAAAIFLVTAVSCLGVPVPGSLALLVGGSFVASGDLGLGAVAGAGLGGALMGDQAGYWLGAVGGERAQAFAGRHGLASAIERARALSERWGGAGVFFSRWLFAPLGPSVNLVSGMVGAAWARFTIYDALGEIVWVTLYISLGYVFSRSIVEIAELTGDLAWFLAAGLVSALLVFRVVMVLRSLRRERAGQGG
jgi:membrane protein DedA with SNARE-associated domain